MRLRLRLIELTHVHQVVVDTFHRDHLQEVVLVVSLLGRLVAVRVVLEEIVEELGEIKESLEMLGVPDVGSLHAPPTTVEPRTHCW